MNSRIAGKAVSAGIYACVFLLGYFLVSAAGTLLRLKDVSAAAALAEADKYEIRSRLLMEAAAELGPCGPENAASLWAEGVMRRNGALQYAAMTAALKHRYATELETTFPNWVTGMSSPWIEKYELKQSTEPKDNGGTWLVTFATATSSGPAQRLWATLTVKKEGDYWRVTSVLQDKGLLAYTGFRN